MSTVVKTPTICIHVYAKTKAQISIAVSAKLISAFVFVVLKLPSYGKVIITILNVQCTCSMFIRCGIVLKFYQKTCFEKRNSIDVECLFCYVAF